MRGDTPPLVTVGLPTYNRAATLRRAVDSVLVQSHAGFELLISDNASDDGTEAYCRGLAAADARVRYRRQPAGLGVHGNFDFVRREAAGRYFVWLGDDDWLEPDYLARCIAALEAVPGATIASGRTRYYRPDGVVFDGILLDARAGEAADRTLQVIRRVVDAGTVYGVMRREALAGLPWVNGWGSDYLFLCEAAWLGPVLAVPETVCHRVDTTAEVAIADGIRRGGIPVDHGDDPYAVIAALLLWRVGLAAGPFATAPLAARLDLAAGCLETVFARWPVLDRRRIGRYMATTFPGEDVAGAVRGLRAALCRLLAGDGSDGDLAAAGRFLDVARHCGLAAIPGAAATIGELAALRAARDRASEPARREALLRLAALATG